MSSSPSPSSRSSAPAMSPLDAAIIRRDLLDENGQTILDRCVEKLRNMGFASFGGNDFGSSFERVTDKGKEVYVFKEDGTLFTTNIVAEVGSASEGTYFGAGPPRPQAHNLPMGDDHPPHRMTIAARLPTPWTEAMDIEWKGALATADGVRRVDQAEEDKVGKKYRVTHWTSREDKNPAKPADLLILQLKQTYEKPGRNHGDSPRRVFNERPTAGEDAVMANAANKQTDVEARQVGDTYPPDMLPDHRGPFFAHDKAQLVQRPYRDVDGSLIAPHELYEKLPEGTLFSAQISLSTYIFKEKPGSKFMDSKVYHINVEKLTVLDTGFGPAWNPPIPTLPTPTPSTPTKRGRNTAVDDMFEDLSPARRARTN